MKSPVKSHQPLEQITLDEGLLAYRCPETGGHWIPLENYWKWQHRSLSESDQLEKDATSATAPTTEIEDVVKLCPITGTIMTRYRVGHGLDFRIDRSITGGVWLDCGEWEALQSGNLHHELHLVFTAPWQKSVRDEEHAAQYDAMLQQHLGDDLHTKLVALRDELKDHPARAEALAFLQAKS